MTPSTRLRITTLLALFTGLAAILILCTSAPVWARGGKPTATPASGTGDGTPYEEPEWVPTDEPVDDNSSGGGLEEDPKDPEGDGPTFEQGGAALQDQGNPGDGARFASPLWRHVQFGLFHLRYWAKH